MRALLVTPVSPLECASGTQQRTHLLHQALCERGDVDVVVLQPATDVSAATSDADDRIVHAMSPERQDWRRFAPDAELTAAVERTLGRRVADYDVVVGRYMWAVTQLVIPRQVPVIADLDDFHYRYGTEAALSFTVLAERTRKALSHQLARRQLDRFAAAFFASALDQADAAIDNRLLPNVPLRILPVPQFATAGHRILFVGSLWYRPNRDGVDWFLREVWPAVTSANPRATLRLVGAAPPAVRAQWSAHAGVEAPGFVDDLDAEYAAAAIAIAPIHSGGGSNIKILEALAHGRACVTTAFCAAAFADLSPARDLVAADAPQQFAEACVDLLRDAQQREAIARSGFAQVTAHYTVERFNGVVHDLVGAVVRRPAMEAAPWPA